MESFPFLDLLLLAMIAGFVLFRLWSVLGRKTGHEPNPRENFSARGDGNVVGLPRSAAQAAPAQAAPLTPLQRALADIRQADRAFDASAFLAGARQAHEMIATAFAAADRETLKNLLDPQIYGHFESAIAEREAKALKAEFSYVRLVSAEIVDAALKGRTAEVTVRFVVELMSALRDAQGAIVEGDPNIVRQVTDVWTFARDTRSDDPNWTLSATGSGA